MSHTMTPGEMICYCWTEFSSRLEIYVEYPRHPLCHWPALRTLVEASYTAHLVQR